MSVNRKVTVPVGRSVMSLNSMLPSRDRALDARRMAMLLEGRTAVVYGGAGRVGGAVARAFAAEGARVFLAGRTLASLEAVAGAIRAAGGSAEAAQVDALDEAAVDAHADAVVAAAGGIDVSFTAVSHGDVHGLPLLELPFEDFARPVATALRAQFLTTRAAARHMARRGSGVIMTITATTARLSIPQVGGTGVRVVWLQTTGLPEAIAGSDVLQPGYGTGSAAMTRDELIAWNQGKAMLGRLTTLAEVGRAAAFLASDHAAAMTAAGLNLTCGQAPGR